MPGVPCNHLCKSDGEFTKIIINNEGRPVI